MAKETQITVGTTPVRVAMNDGPQPKTFLISVEAGSTITLGGSGVVAGQGVTLAAAAQPQTITLVEDDLWAITATATATVGVVEFVSGIV